MRTSRWPILLALAVAALVVRAQEPAPLTLPEERHLRNARQVTFAGENAEIAKYYLQLHFDIKKDYRNPHLLKRGNFYGMR